MALVGRKFNVEKLCTNRDIDGLEQAIAWADAARRPEMGILWNRRARQIEREAPEALASVVADLREAGDIAGLGRAVQCRDPELQRIAAEALAVRTEPEALDALVAKLGYEPAQSALRSAASEPAKLVRLRRMATGELPRPEVPFLPPGTTSPAQRLLVEILMTTSAADDADFLGVLLRDDDEEVRKRAATGLAQVGSARAVETLLWAALDRREDSMLASAAEAATRVGDDEVAALDADLRRRASDWLVEMLQTTGSEKEEALLRLLDQSAAERLAVEVRTKVETLTREVITAFVEGKKETLDWLEAHEDAYAPADIGPLGREFSRLIDRVNTKSDARVNRLREVGRPEVVADILGAMLREGDSVTRDAVARAARELGIASEVSGLPEKVSAERDTLTEVPVPSPMQPARGEPQLGALGAEHYELKCLACGFTHEIPTALRDEVVGYSVDEREVRIICVYGGSFSVTLRVSEFFTIARAPAGGRVLKASIADNMAVLHDHLMSHHDPLFLTISQSPTGTDHEYGKAPGGDSYVRFSAAEGTDIVGKIDLSKAEIPGVS